MALQMALTGVTVEQRDDNFLGDRVYCVIQAKDGEQIEILHTPVTEALHPDQTGRFADSVFYGREGPRDPGDRLEIQYDCWEQDSPAEYEQIREVIDQIERFGKIIAKVTGQGQYVAVIVNVAKAARLITEIATILDGDDHLWQSEESFERRAIWSQIIEHNRTLVAGGVHSGSRWAWKLHLQIDGCAGKVESAPRDPEQPSCRQSCDGCCVGDECQSGSTAEACGSGGDACHSCDPGESCSRGVCQFNDQTQFSVIVKYATFEQCYSSQPFDAYLKIEAGGRRATTQVDHSCQPSWNANVLMTSARSLMDRLIVEVWDADLVFDDQLGVCRVELDERTLLAGEVTFACGNIAEVTLGFEPR